MKNKFLILTAALLTYTSLFPELFWNRGRDAYIARMREEEWYAANYRDRKLIEAICEADNAEVRRLVENRPQILHETCLLNGAESQYAIIAVRHSNYEALEIIVAHGGFVNQPDDEGNTPLMTAAECCNKEMVTFLLKHGADPKIKNNRYHTAYDFAVKSGHDEITKMIKEKGEFGPLDTLMAYAIKYFSRK